MEPSNHFFLYMESVVDSVGALVAIRWILGHGCAGRYCRSFGARFIRSFGSRNLTFSYPWKLAEEIWIRRSLYRWSQGGR
ncbi:hypothetical protein DY000_02037936 [Brassica cretica]|uniref:Uncharacterized protein n=1 Tax=Brassica cretica TaxID=69181 RepID=A0ABQ7B967_BRACR|nr:hypothetical protein DY000_02037936 [Brassica cretica]